MSEPKSWVVEKIGPGGPIAWSGFDENGNYGVRYESGAETWLSWEVLEQEGIKRRQAVFTQEDVERLARISTTAFSKNRRFLLDLADRIETLLRQDQAEE